MVDLTVYPGPSVITHPVTKAVEIPRLCKDR